MRNLNWLGIALASLGLVACMGRMPEPRPSVVRALLADATAHDPKWNAAVTAATSGQDALTALTYAASGKASMSDALKRFRKSWMSLTQTQCDDLSKDLIHQIREAPFKKTILFPVFDHALWVGPDNTPISLASNELGNPRDFVCLTEYRSDKGNCTRDEQKLVRMYIETVVVRNLKRERSRRLKLIQSTQAPNLIQMLFNGQYYEQGCRLGSALVAVDDELRARKHSWSSVKGITDLTKNLDVGHNRSAAADWIREALSVMSSRYDLVRPGSLYLQ